MAPNTVAPTTVAADATYNPYLPVADNISNPTDSNHTELTQEAQSAEGNISFYVIFILSLISVGE